MKIGVTRRRVMVALQFVPADLTYVERTPLAQKIARIEPADLQSRLADRVGAVESAVTG